LTEEIYGNLYNISPSQDKEKENSWLHGEDEYPGRQEDPSAEARKGTQTVNGLAPFLLPMDKIPENPFEVDRRGFTSAHWLIIAAAMKGSWGIFHEVSEALSRRFFPFSARHVIGKR
jgi:hypothetical protein